MAPLDPNPNTVRDIAAIAPAVALFCFLLGLALGLAERRGDPTSKTFNKPCKHRWIYVRFFRSETLLCPHILEDRCSIEEHCIRCCKTRVRKIHWYEG